MSLKFYKKKCCKVNLLLKKVVAENISEFNSTVKFMNKVFRTVRLFSYVYAVIRVKKCDNIFKTKPHIKNECNAKHFLFFFFASEKVLKLL